MKLDPGPAWARVELPVEFYLCAPLPFLLYQTAIVNLILQASPVLTVMDYEDDVLAQFFTPEALQLSESINSPDIQQPKDQSTSALTAPIDSSLQNGQGSSRKRELSKESGDTPESSLEQIGTATNAKRARFDPKRRAEVAELRRRKAVCFRCKVSKAKGGVSIRSS